ncbi:hypothetical protein B0H13DRAFT_2433540 [Mycena leptocephala]|nr:hypothetical protein B0H13DRAFT_2433540 [Mycena leptocephala]
MHGASVSPSRDVNNPRDSRFFERRKEEGPARRRISRQNTFLPAFNNGHKRFGGEEGSRVKEKAIDRAVCAMPGLDRRERKGSRGPIDADLKNARYGGRIDSLLGVLLNSISAHSSLACRTIEYSSRIEPGWDVVHITRTNGTSSERRRKAALEGREASRVRARMQDIWRAHQREIRQGRRISPATLTISTESAWSETGDVVLKYKSIDVAAGLLDESKGEGSEEPVFTHIYCGAESPDTPNGRSFRELFWPI